MDDDQSNNRINKPINEGKEKKFHKNYSLFKFISM